VLPETHRARALAAREIRAAALVKNHPPDLINVALERLVEASLELPAFSTLDELATAPFGLTWSAPTYARHVRRSAEAPPLVLVADDDAVLDDSIYSPSDWRRSSSDTPASSGISGQQHIDGHSDQGVLSDPLPLASTTLDRRPVAPSLTSLTAAPSEPPRDAHTV